MPDGELQGREPSRDMAQDNMPVLLLPQIQAKAEDANCADTSTRGQRE